MQIKQIFSVFILLSVSAFATHQLSEKENLRSEFKRTAANFVANNDPSEVCSLNTEQTTTTTAKLEELVKCIFTTLDSLFDRLDDDITKQDFQDATKGYKYFPQICEIFGTGFNCLKDFEPVLDFCIVPSEQQTKKNIFTLGPILHESVCLQNTTLLIELIKHDAAVRCLYIAFDWLMDNGLFEHLQTNLFESETVCRELNRLQKGAIAEIRDCSTEVFHLSKSIIGNICRQTKCQQYVSNLHCYE